MAANVLSDPKAEATPGMTNMMAFALGADLLANPQDALPVSSFVRSQWDECRVAGYHGTA
jgi:hypothetical protein